jgi:hypothetical protein
MPDHFHWLIDLKRGSLSDLMQRTKSSAPGGESGCVEGQLWQQGFHDRALRERKIW